MSLDLSNGKIEDYLKNDLDVIYKDCVTSTNDELVALAKTGAKEGTVLISSEQTAGKVAQESHFIHQRIKVFI